MKGEGQSFGRGSRKESQEFLELAKELVNRAFSLTKVTRTHELNNRLVCETGERLLETVRALHKQDGEAKLAVSMGLVAVNDSWLKVSLSGYSVLQFLITEFTARGLGSISFGPLLELDELLRFADHFNKVAKEEDPLGQLQRRLQELGIFNILVQEGGKTVVEEDPKHQHIVKRSEVAFTRALQISRDLIGVVKANSRLNFRGAKRSVQAMVDLVLEDETILVALASFKHHDEYTFKHSANVAVYSIIFGQRLGLDRQVLAHLGTCGLFHDIGKMLVPLEVLNKPSKLAAEEWEIMKRHTVFGANYLLKNRQLDDLAARNIVVAFEHHQDASMMGYPSFRKEKEINMFSKIVSIADTYDALTNARVYRKRPFTPMEALGMMIDHRGTKYDETLLKAFVNVLGAYPAGSVVRLNTGDVALVLKSNPGAANLGRPVVRVFADSADNRIEPWTLDLSKKDLVSGKHSFKIVEALDSSPYFSNYREFVALL